jgi:uncharacterized protein YndB with AHSA1/START domain
MDAPLAIERLIDLDLPADELWALIASAEGWQRWMVDHAGLPVVPGASGVVVDDGVERAVLVHEVIDRRAVTFHWSEVGRADDVSRVTLEIVETADGRRAIKVTEQWLAPSACAECPLRAEARWDLRACVLCLTADVSCRV